MIQINKITDLTSHIDGIHAVIFDLDDTLYGEKEYVRSGYETVAGLLPQVDNCFEKLWEAFKAGEPAIDTVLYKEGLYSEELKLKCLNAYRSHKPNIHFYDGVTYMLEILSKQQIKLGLITDGRPEGQRAKIEVLNIEKFINKDNIIITDELGGVEFRKPCTLAFRILQKAFGEPFNSIAYVGDNIKKDFEAPKDLGMKSIFFNNVDGIKR